MGGFVRSHLRFVRVFGTPFKAIEGVKLGATICMYKFGIHSPTFVFSCDYT